jgi:putative transposase
LASDFNSGGWLLAIGSKRKGALRGRTAAVGDDVWAEAKRQARELDKVLDGSDLRRALTARAAAELNLSTRQVYNLLKRYAVLRTIASLLPRRRGLRAKRLSAGVEAIVAATLKEKWMIKEAPPLAPIVDEIRARCAATGERPPSYVSVQRRIALLFDDLSVAKARTSNARHVRRLKARPGYISAARPLAVCQIDHTPTDIQFVEVIDAVGTFVGRAYLTLLVDVFSRAILGFCLTLERPKSLSVALCMAQALCPKDAWLAARGLADYVWPMFGRPETLVVDGGKEFKGGAFARGCKDYGIAIRPRHRGNVHQGGVVERLLGALNGVIGALPGRTGRSVADRDGYPSEAMARLTFADLERCVALAVLDHNLRQNEKTLSAPMSEWTARAAELPRRADDPLQALIAFLPGGERRLTPQGVSFEALDYYAPWLGELVPERDRLGMLEVRGDPRDLSHIYVRHPHTGLFQPAPRRDGRIEPITLWEHKRNRAARRAAAGRTPEMKVALRRAISEIASAAQRPAKVSRAGSPKKSILRAAARSAHAMSADKPYRAMAPGAPPALEHPEREKRALPVEEW